MYFISVKLSVTFSKTSVLSAGYHKTLTFKSQYLMEVGKPHLFAFDQRPSDAMPAIDLWMHSAWLPVAKAILSILRTITLLSILGIFNLLIKAVNGMVVKVDRDKNKLKQQQVT